MPMFQGGEEVSKTFWVSSILTVYAICTQRRVCMLFDEMTCYDCNGSFEYFEVSVKLVDGYVIETCPLCGSENIDRNPDCEEEE